MQQVQHRVVVSSKETNREANSCLQNLRKRWLEFQKTQQLISGYKMETLNGHGSDESHPYSWSVVLPGLAAAAASAQLFVLMPVTGGERPLLAVNRQAGVELATLGR